jgi:hypothetical protein
MQPRWRLSACLLLQLALVPCSCLAHTILAVPMFARNSPSLDVAAVAGELQLRWVCPAALSDDGVDRQQPQARCSIWGCKQA